MNGTWKVTGGAGVAVGAAVALVAAAVAVDEVASLLAALLLTLVITAAVVVVALVVGVVLLRRHYDPGRREQIARQGAALRAYAEQQALAAHPVTVVHYHGGTHLHVEPGADAAAILRQAVGWRTGAGDCPPVDP